MALRITNGYVHSEISITMHTLSTMQMKPYRAAIIRDQPIMPA